MYEYKRYVWYVGSRENPIERLNEFARDGWRVIGMRTSLVGPGEAEIYTLERGVTPGIGTTQQ